MVGGRLGLSDHEVMEFLILGKVRRRVNREQPRGQILSCLGDWFTESLKEES